VGIGKKLEALIKLRGRERKEVAEAIGMPPSTLYSIIDRDTNKIDIDILFALADELGVRVDYFSNRDLDGKEEASQEIRNAMIKELNILRERKPIQALVLSSADATDEEIDSTIRIIKALKDIWLMLKYERFKGSLLVVC
jgi:transcriptional regulator with XRE-family HTH domain